MSLIFVSHSSQNNDAAIAMRTWLQGQGWDRIFIDLDPQAGLAPGQNWRRELQRAGHECEAVVLLISPEWAASKWCMVEYLLARQLGKSIFPVFIAETPHSALPAELLSELQFVDISDPTNQAAALEGLAIGLRRAGIEPGGFPWPPHSDPGRLPYRGLETYEIEDAGIYFGRQDSIAEVLATIRAPDHPPRRLYVILGASGGGKSSFLRAGLLSRLSRLTEEFLVLPIIRPSSGLSDIEQTLADVSASRNSVQNWAARTILAIDQAEEIFQHETGAAAVFLNQLAVLLAKADGPTVLMTIRSDMFAELQASPAIAPIRKELVDLAPMPQHAWPEVISRPAEVAGHTALFSPPLISRIIEDYERGEALPLLSYMLKHLYVVGQGGQKLDLAYYEETGGLNALLEWQTALAIRKWRARTEDPRETGQAVSELFIPWLVSVDNETGAVRRRVALWDHIPKEQHDLANLLIQERLLVSKSSRTNGRTLEVVHEALFHVWPTLKHVLDANLLDLRQSQRILSDAERWESNNRIVSDLICKGERRKDALAVVERAPSLFAAQKERVSAYLWECWRHDWTLIRRTKYLLLFFWLICFFVTLRIR